MNMSRFIWLALLTLNILLAFTAAFLLTIDPTRIVVPNVLIVVMIIGAANIVFIASGG